MTVSPPRPRLPLTPGADADPQLVAAARDGHAEARERLAEEHRRAAYLLALQLVRNRDDALDVAQEAMLRFFTTLDRFDVQRPVRPWLLCIVRNCARDLQRRQKVRRAEPLGDGRDGGAAGLDEPPPLEVPDHGPDPEALAARAELQRQLWHALGRLSEPHREILVLRDYQDLAYAEIAEVLRIPLGTVMSRLHAARKQLRETLGGAHRRPA
jgi:RNA polymerase sigma-70 factor (ECF subfamily)